MDASPNVYERLKKAFSPFNCNHDLRRDRHVPFSLKKLPHCNLGLVWKDLVKCSVLILLFQSEKKLHVILTIRSFKLKSFPGEMCFPGGKFDEALDTSFEQTAFREANEEIGLEQDNLCIIGKLCPIITPIGHYIVPVVGLVCHSKQNSPDGTIDAEETIEVVKRLQPNADEVEAIIHVPLSYVIENSDDENIVSLFEEKVDKGADPKIISEFTKEFKGPFPENFRRLLVTFEDRFFSDTVKPKMNFLYGLNASLFFFVSYLFEKELNMDEKYALRFKKIDEAWAPLKVLNYINQVRLFAFVMYKVYTARKRSVKPKPKL